MYKQPSPPDPVPILGGGVPLNMREVEELERMTKDFIKDMDTHAPVITSTPTGTYTKNRVVAVLFMLIRFLIKCTGNENEIVQWFSGPLKDAKLFWMENVTVYSYIELLLYSRLLSLQWVSVYCCGRSFLLICCCINCSPVKMSIFNIQFPPLLWGVYCN